jgi:predicted transcriptional regulator
MNKTDPIVYVLRQYRVKAALSQRDISISTGISERTIQRIESGKTDMKFSQYRRYLLALDITDMDVSVAMLSHQFISEDDIAAVARRLPFSLRSAI